MATKRPFLPSLRPRMCFTWQKQQRDHEVLFGRMLGSVGPLSTSSGPHIFLSRFAVRANAHNCPKLAFRGVHEWFWTAYHFESRVNIVRIVPIGGAVFLVIIIRNGQFHRRIYLIKRLFIWHGVHDYPSTSIVFIHYWILLLTLSFSFQKITTAKYKLN